MDQFLFSRKVMLQDKKNCLVLIIKTICLLLLKRGLLKRNHQFFLLFYAKYSLIEMKMFHNNVKNSVKFSMITCLIISNLLFHVSV